MTAQANISLRTELFPRLIFAAAECAATKDIRTQICGVRLEFRNNNCFIVGTTGTMVGVFKQYADMPDIEVTIPHDVIKRINKKADYVTLRLDNGQWVIDGIEFRPVEGFYPDWRRVITAPDVIQEQVMVDPELFAKGAKAIKYAFGSKVMPGTLSTQGGEGIIMHVGDSNGFVMIMGIRKTKRPYYKPMAL
jgi:DNA polymerase III sliding clamp (beta) subunit (PCNA family)